MTYTTLAALVGRFGECTLVNLTDRAAVPTGTIDASVVAQAIVGTGAVIDASLAVRYRLPLDQVPVAVAELALAIAIYKLHVFAPDPKVEKDYDQALKDLADIAAGRKRLDLAGVEPTTSGAGGVVVTDRERPLTAETMGGFI